MKSKGGRTTDRVGRIAVAIERLEQRQKATEALDKILYSVRKDEQFSPETRPEEQLQREVDELLYRIRGDFERPSPAFSSKTRRGWLAFSNDAVRRLGADAGIAATNAARCEQAAKYIIHRRLRPPSPNGKASAVAFAHDAKQTEKLLHMIEEARSISGKGIHLGHGGREAMITALEFAMGILSRVPTRTLLPIIGQLSILQDVLIQLSAGIVHPALKPVDEINGRPLTKRVNVIGREFRYRCTMAAILGRELSEKKVYENVYEAARTTASVVASFEEESGQSARRQRTNTGAVSERKRGPLTFTSETIREWVKRYRPALKKFCAEDFDQTSSLDAQWLEHASIYRSMIFPQLKAYYRDAYMQGLQVDELHRPIFEIIDEQPFSIDRTGYLERALPSDETRYRGRHWLNRKRKKPEP